MRMLEDKPLDGRVALVGGATRGAGRAIAVELSRAGAYVYGTGRSSDIHGPSEIGRPETIEQTERLIRAAGGAGEAVRVDHADPAEVAALVTHIETDRGRLDILVNDMFGGDRYSEFDKPLWEHDLSGGLRMLRMGIDTHLITSATAIPLLLRDGGGLVVEVTDGTAKINARVRPAVGFYYDLIKACVQRIIDSLSCELAAHPVSVIGVTPGWLRSEQMLDNFKVSEATWRMACGTVPGFEISESPTYVARGIAALAGDPAADRFAGQVLTARQLADTYAVTDTDGSRPDCWGLVDTYGFDHGRPDDIEQYR